jgi:hypothetical protein
MAVVRVVQMAVVQVIDVVLVLDARVPAMLAVSVLVIAVNMMAHRSVLLGTRVGDFFGSQHIQSSC